MTHRSTVPSPAPPSPAPPNPLAVGAALAELEHMTVAELAARFEALFGRPTRTRNRDYLRKRLGWRVQELASRGLSPSAVARIASLGDGLPERWRMREVAAGVPVVAEAPAHEAPRDPRLPPPGTTLRRVVGREVHEVFVLAGEFDYRGERFKTLSAVAKRITGTAWNGFAFFALPKAPRKEAP